MHVILDNLLLSITTPYAEQSLLPSACTDASIFVFVQVRCMPNNLKAPPYLEVLSWPLSATKQFYSSKSRLFNGACLSKYGQTCLWGSKEFSRNLTP